MLRHTIACADYFRLSPWRLNGRGGHREWLHFSVVDGPVTLLINFSVADETLPGARPGDEIGRLTLLYCDERGWRGDVGEFSGDELEIRGGYIEARLGESRVRFHDGVFELTAKLERAGIAVRLRLAPVTFPSVANNVRLGEGPALNWVVVPRLRAHGDVTVDGRSRDLVDAPAYHDHNWGHLAGADFSWEWGFILPSAADVPWTAVFARISNRARTQVFMQALLLWSGIRQHRVLRADELSVRRRGELRAPSVTKVPPIMALLAPGLATDVPREFVIDAAADGDRLRCEFHPRHVGQVIVPSDDGVSATAINEVTGAATLSGAVRGEAIELSGVGVFEFLDG